MLRGWGVMNPVALKTAVKVGYPVDHIIGNVWSNSEEDVIPAGDAAMGYTAITTQASGNQYPVVQEIIKTVYGAGKGNLDDKNRIGSVYHNLGIVNGILNVEAVRIAQEKFGHRTLTGDEVRWGFEHLQARSGPGRGARRKGPVPLDQRHLGEPRGRRLRDVPAMGRQEVERRLRLDRAGLEAAAPDHRAVGRKPMRSEKGIKVRTASDVDAVHQLTR